MKVLSIREPYATLIKKKVKHIETRSWKTNYRGELYIYASKTKMFREDAINKELMKLVSLEELNYGYIICKCKLVDCVLMDQEFLNSISKNEAEFVCGIYELGRYAWIFEDIDEVELVPAKGRLNIWEYTA